MNTELPAWAASVFKAVGVAALLGAGTSVITTQQKVAVHDMQLQSVDKLATRLDALNDKLDTTNSKLDQVIGGVAHGK